MYGGPQPPSRPLGPASNDYGYTAPVSSSKEQEVDALTQMLMQGLEGSKDPDFYGMDYSLWLFAGLLDASVLYKDYRQYCW